MTKMFALMPCFFFSVNCLHCFNLACDILIFESVDFKSFAFLGTMLIVNVS